MIKTFNAWPTNAAAIAALAGKSILMAKRSPGTLYRVRRADSCAIRSRVNHRSELETAVTIYVEKCVQGSKVPY